MKWICKYIFFLQSDLWGYQDNFLQIWVNWSSKLMTHCHSITYFKYCYILIIRDRAYIIIIFIIILLLLTASVVWESSWLQNGSVLCFLCGTNWIYIWYIEESRPSLWSDFLATDLEVRVRFPALLDFLGSSGSGAGSTQPREYNWGATWKEN
jgi:hypothetical protein